MYQSDSPILSIYLDSTVCTLYRVLYTGAQAHCGSYVCVMQHCRALTAVGGAHNSPMSQCHHDIEEWVSPHQVTFI